MTSFWGVFWIDVSTEQLAQTGFLDIASRLQVPVQTWEDARQCLANTPHPWLLVLDNADDPHLDYQPYFPSGSSGMVVLTSRNDHCQQYAPKNHIALDGLTGAAACELLLGAAQIPRAQQRTLQDDAQLVTSLLQSHPLALIQAGAYVARGHCTLAEYPRRYEQQRKRLLAFRPTQAKSRYGDVYATFEASAATLQSLHTESARDALQLLPVLATCAPNRLPLPLFEVGWEGAQSVSPSGADDDEGCRLTAWHVSRLPSVIQADADAWDSFRLIEAINLLKAFSLLSTDTHDGHLSVSMHPLIHAWARDRLGSTEQHESWLATGCLVAISGDAEDFWQKNERQLQPHLQALTSWQMDKIFAAEPVMMIVAILEECGCRLEEMRDDATLFDLINKLFTHLGLDPLTVDERWLSVYRLAATSLSNHAKSEEAVSLLEQVVNIERQILAESHPSRLASQHELARAYLNNGQVQEAVSLLEQVVNVERQILAENHPSRLASQHELAKAYLNNGQVQEAVSLLEQVVKIRGQILAENHPSRLTSQHELARAYLENGQVQEAVSLLEQVVNVERQILAENHPSRLASQHVLATIYWELGRRSTALQMMKHVVNIRRQVLDEHYPHRKTSEEWHEIFESEMRNLGSAEEHDRRSGS